MTKPSTMKASLLARVAVLLAGLLMSASALAASGGDTLQAGVDLDYVVEIDVDGVDHDARRS